MHPMNSEKSGERNILTFARFPVYSAMYVQYVKLKKINLSKFIKRILYLQYRRPYKMKALHIVRTGTYSLFRKNFIVIQLILNDFLIS